MYASGVAIALLMGGAGYAGYRYYDAELHSPHRAGQPTLTVDIPAGTSVSGVADILAHRGVIGSALVFEIYVRTHGAAARLEAGHHQIPGGLNLVEVVSLIEHSRGREVRVTIPEGYNSQQIAALLQQKGLFPANQYLTATRAAYTYDFLAGHPPGSGLEGYLFPDTYFFDPRATTKDVIEVQLRRFGEQVPAPLRAHAGDHQLRFDQALVMASIIEREARFDQDRALIAGVFYNRLAAGMKLEADATVLYAKGATSGEISDQDKRINSPYNTYLETGLPPGAICNPGLPSIQAALIPANSDFLFYLTDHDGHAHFSRTLAEHQQQQIQYGVR